MTNLPTVNFTYLERINKFDEELVQVTGCPFEEAKEFIAGGHLSVKEYVELLVEQDHPTIEQLALFARYWNGKDDKEETVGGRVWVDSEDAQVMIDMLTELITNEV